MTTDMKDVLFHLMIAVPAFVISLAAWVGVLIVIRRQQLMRVELNHRLSELVAVSREAGHAQGVEDERTGHRASPAAAVPP